MKNDFTYSIKRTRFDENYVPSENTRLTTNFANLARGANRKENLRKTIEIINNRFNSLATWDNPKSNRYSLELEIISADLQVKTSGEIFPSLEILNSIIIDHETNQRIPGIVGNNFSSYVRDYDFSVLLLDYNKNKSEFSAPENFGILHGRLFEYFVNSECYKQNFDKPPVICLSVSDNKTYKRNNNYHPILGFEYEPNASSLTEQYFQRMGFTVRYFIPPNCTAPLAFYFYGDLLNDYTNLELISTISAMEAFQKIYRPEIYNANSSAGLTFKPSLKHSDYSSTQIVYDREERRLLAIKQGQYAQKYFIEPYHSILEKWSNNDTL